MESKNLSKEESVLDSNIIPKQAKPTCEFSPEEIEVSN